MKNLSISVSANRPIPKYDVEDFGELIQDTLTSPIYNLCEGIDNAVAMLKGHATSRRATTIDMQILNNAIAAYGENQGNGKFSHYLYRELESKR